MIFVAIQIIKFALKAILITFLLLILFKINKYKKRQSIGLKGERGEAYILI